MHPDRSNDQEAFPNLFMDNITIGIPVFNEESFIEKTVRSAINQSRHIIISDNASNDRTQDICLNLCKEFNNIKYFRQENNIGSLKNFEFILNLSTTPYFMWLSGHDLIPNDYVNKLITKLEQCPGAVLAFANVKHIDLNDNFLDSYQYHYFQELGNEDKLSRLFSLVWHLGECSLIHGVFRTEALKSSWQQGEYLGIDHVILCKAATLGFFICVPDLYFNRRNAHPNDTLEEQFVRISGRKSSINNGYLNFQLKVLDIVESISRGRGIRGLRVRILSRLIYIFKYGPFAKTRAGLVFASLTYFFFNTFKIIFNVYKRINKHTAM